MKMDLDLSISRSTAMGGYTHGVELDNFHAD